MDHKTLQDTLDGAGLTAEQARFAGSAINHGAHQLATHGHVPLQALILTNPEDGSDPGIMLAACPVVEDQQTKALFMETVRFLAHKENSRTVAILMEAWTAPDMKRERFQELLEEHGSISNMPGAGEAVCVLVNSEEGNHQVQMRIVRDDEGNVTDLSDIAATVDKDGEMSGFMLHSRYSPEEIGDPGFPRRLIEIESYLEGRMTDIEPNEEGKPGGHLN